jgi:O-antigen ligase
MRIKNIQLVIGLLILGTLYVPQGYIIDRVAWQWLYLAVVNLFGLVSNLILVYKGKIKPVQLPFSFKTFFILFLWAIISISYSLSFQITVIDLSRFFLYLVTFYNLIIVLNEFDVSFSQFSHLFLILFIYEIFFSYIPLIDFLSQGTFKNSMSNDLEGIASNVNITSFSIALKIPFLVYLFFSKKNFFSRVIVIFLICLGFILLNFLNTRAISLANYFILFTILVYGLVNYNKSVLLKSFFLISAIFLSFNLPSILSNDRADKTKEIVQITTENDESTNQRLRYYKAGVKQILSNPFIGVGLGNWKLESIHYDSESSVQYIVPYHMHNDFLQFGAELGIIGLLIYIVFFSSSFFRYLVNLKNLKVQYDLKALAVSLFFIYIFFDSNLNFPFARPMIYIQLLLFIVFLEKQQTIHKK